MKPCLLALASAGALLIAPVRRVILGSAIFMVAVGASTVSAGEVVLYRFNGGDDGANPYAASLFDTRGAIYGTTTQGGGPGNNGTVFKLTPPRPGSSPSTPWTETILHKFTGNDGAYPSSGLIFDSHGALYGTTSNGGSGYGVVFELTPPVAPATEWTARVLHAFTGGADGATPTGFNETSAGLLIDTGGALYGTTTFGGSGSGVVFKLTPPISPSAGWTETVLYNFTGGLDGGNPTAGLISGSTGALYGTAANGGNGNGVVFKLTPSRPGLSPPGPWTYTTLYRFNGTDGSFPVNGLVFDNRGALYGVTDQGGHGSGVVLKLTPPPAGSPPATLWTETVLYNFDSPDAYPRGNLIFDQSGALYGETGLGGSGGTGTLFKLTAPRPGSPPTTSWTHTVLINFTGGADGGYLPGNLVFDRFSGDIYGPSAGGGNANLGLVFKMTGLFCGSGGCPMR